MSNLPILKFRALDNNGTVLPGATLDFYQWSSGPTSTRQGTWSDLARTVPNANPVVANSAGYFPEIYLDPSLPYYVVFKTAAGVLIDDFDEIYATSLGSSSLLTRIQQGGTSPIDFGAVGDGVADESGEVQDAIDAVGGTTRVVDLLGKTYRCDHFLSIYSSTDNIKIINGTLDFSACADDNYIEAVGSMGSTITLSSNITAGDTSISASTSGLSVGDVLFLSSTALWRGGSGQTGELVVYSVAGTGIPIATPARDNYTTGTSNLRKITFVEGVTFENVTIIGSTSASGTGVLFYGYMCRRLRFVDCKFTGIKKSGIRLYTSLDTNIINCHFEKGASGSIGIEVVECCEQVVVDKCAFERLDQEIDIGANATIDGVCRDIVISKSRFVGAVAGAIAIKELAQNVTLESNEIETGAISAVTLESASEVKLIGNKIRSTAHTLYASGIVDGVFMTDNLFLRLTITGPTMEFAGAGAGNISNINIVGNRIVGGTYGITGSNVSSGTFARGLNLFSGQATGESTGLGNNPAIDDLRAVNINASGTVTASALTADRAVVTSTGGLLAVAAGLPATLDGSSKVVQDPANATATPSASKIVMAGGAGTIASGWIPDISGTYATAAKGVTNGDSHDHSGGDGGQIAHTALSSIGTNSHSAIDTFIASKGQASGLAALTATSGIAATDSGANPGVEGASTTGPGGRFASNATRASVNFVSTTTIPSSPVVGDMIYYSTQQVFCIFTGFGWQKITAETLVI